MTARAGSEGFVLHRVYAEERLSRAGLLVIRRAQPVIDGAYRPGGYSERWVLERRVATWLLPDVHECFTYDWSGAGWSAVTIPYAVAEDCVSRWAECGPVARRWASFAIRSFATVARGPEKTAWTQMALTGSPEWEPRVGTQEWRRARFSAAQNVAQALAPYVAHKNSLIDRVSLLVGVSTHGSPRGLTAAPFDPLTPEEIEELRNAIGPDPAPSG